MHLRHQVSEPLPVFLALKQLHLPWCIMAYIQLHGVGWRVLAHLESSRCPRSTSKFDFAFVVPVVCLCTRFGLHGKLIIIGETIQLASNYCRRSTENTKNGSDIGRPKAEWHSMSVHTSHRRTLWHTHTSCYGSMPSKDLFSLVSVRHRRPFRKIDGPGR